MTDQKNYTDREHVVYKDGRSNGVIRGIAGTLLVAGIGIGSFFLGKGCDSDHQTGININGNNNNVNSQYQGTGSGKDKSAPSKGTGGSKGTGDTKTRSRTDGSTIDNTVGNTQNLNNKKTMTQDEYLEAQRKRCDRIDQMHRVPQESNIYMVDGMLYKYTGRAENDAFAFDVFIGNGNWMVQYMSPNAWAYNVRNNGIFPLGNLGVRDIQTYMRGYNNQIFRDVREYNMTIRRLMNQQMNFPSAVNSASTYNIR